MRFLRLSSEPESMTGVPLNMECEVKHGEWKIIGIDEASMLKKDEDSRMRCPACKGQVASHEEYLDGVRPHFEHLIAHTGCNLSEWNFCGVRSIHPQPLM